MCDALDPGIVLNGGLVYTYSDCLRSDTRFGAYNRARCSGNGGCSFLNLSIGGSGSFSGGGRCGLGGSSRLGWKGRVQAASAFC